MKNRLNLVLLGFLFLILSSTAFPCTSVTTWGDGKPPCRKFNKYNFIAFGKAVKSEIIKTDEDKEYTNDGIQIIDFKIEDNFKGFRIKTIKLEYMLHSCNSPFKVGEKFIVYTNDSTPYKINNFTQTNEDNFRAEFEYFKFIKKKPAGATISGQFVNVFRKSIDDYDKYSGIKDMEVLIKSPKSEYKVKTNKDGRFLLYGLDKGKYQVSVDIFNWEGEQLLSTLNLNSDSCESVGGFNYEQGYIRGTLLNPNGEFASNIELELIAIDPKTNKPTEDTISAETYENGEFFFESIPQGKYLIAHNHDDDELDEKIYPRLFYPGVKEFNSSSIIEVKNKKGTNLGVFQLVSEKAGERSSN